MFLRRLIRLGGLVMVLAACSTTYALAAAQELTATAPSAAVAAPGLGVMRVSYEVDTADPERVRAVRLRVAAPTRGTVLATLDGGTTWLECRASRGELRCPTHGTQVRVQDATGLSLGRAS